VDGSEQNANIWPGWTRLRCKLSVCTYKDIMDNLDSTVVKLRRKRKIILANEQLKDLL